MAQRESIIGLGDTNLNGCWLPKSLSRFDDLEFKRDKKFVCLESIDKLNVSSKVEKLLPWNHE